MLTVPFSASLDSCGRLSLPQTWGQSLVCLPGNNAGNAIGCNSLCTMNNH